MNHFNFIRQSLDNMSKSKKSIKDIPNLKEYSEVRSKLFKIYKEKCLYSKINTNECKIVYNLLFSIIDKE